MRSSRINVFGCVNHVGNQYELLKLAKKYPVKFWYLENNVRRWTDRSARPEPTTWLTKDEFEWVDRYEAGKYDMAMLHVDQQHIDPNIGKGQLYRALNKIIQDIPKVVINHGTPMWNEMFTEDIVVNGGEILDKKGKKKRLGGMKELIGDNYMIVNSYTAVERWGWGYPLIHGLDPDEWVDVPKEPRVVISLSPGGLDKYYNRSLLTSIKGYVKEESGLEVQHITVNYKAKDWEDYKRYLSTGAIYINMTLDSPMPRSRTEAMFSGCCVLTSRHHGADEFIENGVNGFILPDNPISYSETIHHLLNSNYREVLEIGQRGKETAKKLFNSERYLKDLWHIVETVSKKGELKWNGEKIWD